MYIMEFPLKALDLNLMRSFYKNFMKWKEIYHLNEVLNRYFSAPFWIRGKKEYLLKKCTKKIILSWLSYHPTERESFQTVKKGSFGILTCLLNKLNWSSIKLINNSKSFGRLLLFTIAYSRHWGNFQWPWFDLEQNLELDNIASWHNQGN